MKRITFKMLFSDIDGTLLNSQHEVSSETKHAIQSLPKDFSFVLVSERMPKGIMHLHKELKLTTPIICYGGALVIDVTNDASYLPILNKTMTLNYIKTIYLQAKMRNLHISFYKNDDWFIEDKDDWAIQEEDITKTNPTVIGYQELFRIWERTKIVLTRYFVWGKKERLKASNVL